MPLSQQVTWLFLLALPIASIAWTVTHEEVFREPRDFCRRKSEGSRSVLSRKFFYLFTCEYCFSHGSRPLSSSSLATNCSTPTGEATSYPSSP
ncbi:MAG: hypothetical protein ACLPPV_14950 [Candidatus Korobacteraceae bacterium]|jgi:hypothetical protein